MEYLDNNKGFDELYFIGEYKSKTFLYGRTENKTNIYIEENGSKMRPIEEEDREDLTALLSKDEIASDRFKRYTKEENFKDKKRIDKPWLAELIQSLF